MQGLALIVQQLHRDLHGGDLFVFRGWIGSLVKIIWHDVIGMSLTASQACLPARGHRLAESAVQLAPGERRIAHYRLARRGRE